MKSPTWPAPPAPDPAAARAAPPPGGARLALRLLLAMAPLAAGLALRGRGHPTFLAVHLLAGIASVVLAFAAFAVQWHAGGTDAFDDARARFLGLAALGMAALETVHLLSYPGMPGFLGGSADRAVLLRVAWRLWFVAALVAVAWIPPRSDSRWLRRYPLLAATAALVAAATAASFGLPAAGLGLLRGRGPAALLVAAEAAIGVLAIAGAAVHALRHRRVGDPLDLPLLEALVLVALSQLCLALRGAVFDGLSLAGHLYQVAAMGLAFRALFAAAVVRPYERLDAALADLAASHEELAGMRRHVEDELAVTIARLEESTRKEHQALAEVEAAVAAVPDGLVVYSHDGVILRMNAAAEAILGYPAAVRDWPFEARWRSLRPEGSDGRPIEPEASPIRRALRGETVLGAIVALRPPGRRPVRVSLGAAPTRAPDGGLTGAVASLTDVGILDDLRDQREKLLRAVSHDLRNPLQVILLQAERLQRVLGEGAAPARRAADAIAGTARDMGVTIHDLVDSARLEMGLLRLSPEPVPLATFLERLVAARSRGWGPRVRVEAPWDLPPVSADPARLERIFSSLVGHTLRASPPEGEVRVGAAAAFEDVLISVSGRGLGLAPEELPWRFERLRGGSQGTAEIDPSLHFARLLVEAHGGRIWVESRPGVGNAIAFTLPRAAGA